MGKVAPVEQIVALKRAGWTNSVIARELGIGRRTVMRHVRAAGFPPDPNLVRTTHCWCGLPTYVHAGHNQRTCRHHYHARVAWNVKRRYWEARVRAGRRGALTKLVLVLLENGPVTVPELATEAGRTRETIRSTVLALRDAGRVTQAADGSWALAS